MEFFFWFFQWNLESFQYKAMQIKFKYPATMLRVLWGAGRQHGNGNEHYLWGGMSLLQYLLSICRKVNQKDYSLNPSSNDSALCFMTKINIMASLRWRKGTVNCDFYHHTQLPSFPKSASQPLSLRLPLMCLLFSELRHPSSPNYIGNHIHLF